MVFWILLWSKSHSEQFSQVERSGGVKLYTWSTLKPNLNPNPKRWFCCKNKSEKKKCVTVYQSQKFFSASGFSTLAHKMGTP